MNLLPAINLSGLLGWGTFQLNPQLLVDNSCGFGWGVPHFNGHVILLDGDVIMTNYLFLILNAPPPSTWLQSRASPGFCDRFFRQHMTLGRLCSGSTHIYSISDSAFSINVIGRRHVNMMGMIRYFVLISVFIYLMLFCCCAFFLILGDDWRFFFYLFFFSFSFIFFI